MTRPMRSPLDSPVTIPCPECEGRGYLDIRVAGVVATGPCPLCRGKKRVPA